MWTDTHRFNHRLRGRVAPCTVGNFGVVDATKAGIARLSRRPKRLLRPGGQPPSGREPSRAERNDLRGSSRLRI